MHGFKIIHIILIVFKLRHSDFHFISCRIRSTFEQIVINIQFSKYVSYRYFMIVYSLRNNRLGYFYCFYVTVSFKLICHISMEILSQSWKGSLDDCTLGLCFELKVALQFLGHIMRLSETSIFQELQLVERREGVKTYGQKTVIVRSIFFFFGLQKLSLTLKFAFNRFRNEYISDSMTISSIDR